MHPSRLHLPLLRPTFVSGHTPGPRRRALRTVPRIAGVFACVTMAAALGESAREPSGK